MDLSDDLREVLGSFATPPSVDLDDELVVVRRAASLRRSKRRRLSIGVATLMVVTAVGAGVLLRPSDHASRSVVADGSPTTSAVSNQPITPAVPPDTPTIASSAVSTIPLAFAPVSDSGARAVAVGAGSVWVLGYDGGAGFVVRIDPDNGKEEARIALPNSEGVFSLSFGEGALWLVTSASDPIPRDLGFATWVTAIDPTTNAVKYTIKLSGSHEQGHAGQRPRIATGNGAAWVTFQRSLIRVDAQTGQVSDPIALPSLTYGVASTPGSIWLVEWQGPIQRYNTNTGDLTAAASIDAPFVQSVAASNGAVWVTHAQAQPSAPNALLDLTRIDATTAVATATNLATSQVTSNGTRVWIVGYHPNEATPGPNNNGFVAELDPTSGTIIETGQIQVGQDAQLDATVDDTRLWILDATAHSLVRVVATILPEATPAPSDTPTTVAGTPGGPPPCATDNLGSYGADTAHPQYAPLQGTMDFDNGTRWALCGASQALSSEVLNLRSDDNGATWQVATTPMSFSPHHAGDHIDIQFESATSARVSLMSLVVQSDTVYTTDDGGTTWSRSG